jgi:hypothetical protein
MKSPLRQEYKNTKTATDPPGNIPTLSVGDKIGNKTTTRSS